MPEKPMAPFFRDTAIPLSVYNEGSCVYVSDEAAHPALRDLMQSAGKPGEPLAESFSRPEFAAAVAERGLAFCYDLRQDDPIAVEVIAGGPLSPAERRKIPFLKLQEAYLHLPSGRLRVDTPNTCPLDPDPGRDQPGIATVVPGHYAVTLYRVDFEELERLGKRYAGPDTVVVLTPIGSAPASPPPPLLPFPLPDPMDGARGAFKIQGTTFTAMARVEFWREPVVLNLERGAVEPPGWAEGTIIEVEFGKKIYSAYYAPEQPRLFAEQSFPAEKIGPLQAQAAETCIALWHQPLRLDGGPAFPSLLHLVRYQPKEPVAKKFHRKWLPVKGRILRPLS